MVSDLHVGSRDHNTNQLTMETEGAAAEVQTVHVSKTIIK